MTASVIYLKNALCPQKRVIEYVHGGTLMEYDPKWELPYIALVNGQPVLRENWDRSIHQGDILAFVDINAIPQDGGGGGSNPLKMVAMIAIMVYAPYLATSMGFTAGTVAFSVATAAIGMVGSALVNAILPPPTAQTSAQQTAALASPSPTYSLQAQGNSARLEAAIPEHFGRLVAYMDFAAQPYVEYVGNEQFLYQLLCVGRGEYDIEAIRIEDTAIGAFDEITYEVIAPNTSPTLFPSAVVSSVEVSGQDLSCRAATYSQGGTTLTVTLAAHGLSTGKSVYLDITSGTATDGTYTVTSAPTADTFTVTAVSATTSGNVTVSPWLGGFVANASGSTVNALGLDFVMPRGIYYANDNGSLSNVTLSVAAERRTVDDAGSPTGSWTVLGSASYTAATTTPQRHSERYTVAAARYEVRVRRTDIEQTDTRYGHDVVWAGLRAYLPESRTFGDVTLIAMRMRASNNLSMQASRKVNVIATRKLPIWDGATWSANTATRSIAWPIAYACKQMGLTDAQIDLATLLVLDATWTARGDHFDARFDNFISFWEAVTKMAGAGRAKPYMQGGIMRIMRDQAATIPVALFSMRNIVKGSFSVDYLMPTADMADAIDVGYFDSGNWAPRRVRAKLSGSTAARPAKIELFGVTDRDHAFREGMYQAASNRYRRKIIKFQTEMEGFIPSFGDLIAIQHDMPAWGQGGEIVAWDADSLTATLSEPPEWGAGTHYIALRKRDGGVDGPHAVAAGATAHEVVLASAPDATPYTGGAEERTHYTFGWAETWRQPGRVLAVRPRGLNLVEIEAVNEDVNVHTAEVGQVAPTAQTSQLANYTNAPVVIGLTAVSVPNYPEKMLLTWQPSPWAEYYLIEQSTDGLAWTRSGEVSSSNFTATALYGSATILRVAAVGLARGPWVQVNYGLLADYMWFAADTTLMWNAVDTTAMWRY
jgi:hypothetical protein